MSAVDMQIIIVSAEDSAADWLEKHYLESKRIEILSLSLADTRARLTRARADLDNARAEAIAAAAAYQDALIKYADDEDDDFETSIEKARKFERIEAEYVEAPAKIAAAEKIYEEACTRVAWELAQAKKAGIGS